MRMPTSSTRTAGSALVEGFTLIELLAVMTILAIAITAFTYAGTSSLETSKFRAFMVRASAVIRDGRVDAIRSMQEQIVYVDVKGRRIGRPERGGLLDLPRGVDLKAEVAAQESYADGTVGIRFYPAGNSSGGTLSFTFHGQVYEIRVNWLTGNVTTVRI